MVLMLVAAFLLGTPHGPVAEAQPAAVPNGRFLHLSDVHLDPFADPTLFGQLSSQPVDQWEAIFKGSGVQTPVTGRNQDTNYPLLASLLSEAKLRGPYDFVVVTGDYMSHGFVDRMTNDLHQTPAQIEAFAAKTVSFVNREIAQAFPGAPIVATLGNNDSDCNDYQLSPGGDILPKVGADLPVIAGDPAALADFKAGGYYLTPHPTVAKLDFIVLSVFWSRKYVDGCPVDPRNPGDPAQAQLQWLTKTLAAEQAAGRRAILLMHIPPGIDGFSAYHSKGRKISTLWTADQAMLGKVQAVLQTYRAQLAGGFAGHTHMDEFRVLGGSQPFLAIRMAPGVTPWDGNRPAFSTFTYDTNDGTALDYSVESYSAAAGWASLYSFGATYGLKRYDAASLGSLGQRLLKDPNTRTCFGKYYAAGTPGPASRAGDWRYFGCALTTLTLGSYKACVAAAPAAVGTCK
jgi:3',5'-cyclic AMP phosphodiesterase CpdA